MKLLRPAKDWLAKIILMAALIPLWLLVIAAINPEVEDSRLTRNSGYATIQQGRVEVIISRPYHDKNVYSELVTVADTSFVRAKLSTARIDGEVFVIKADSAYSNMKVNWFTVGVADSLAKRR